MNSWFRKILVICLSLVLLAGNVSPSIAQTNQARNNLAPRFVPVKPVHTKIMDWQSRTVIQVKFAEGLAYRLRDGNITTLRSDSLGGIKSVLQKYPVKQIERLFTLSEEQIQADQVESESLSGKRMPDLNLWYRFTVQAGTNPEALIDALNALPEVELATPALLPAPLPTESVRHDQNSAPAVPILGSPNYLAQQGYITPATNGINAKYAWGLPGGTGAKAVIVDIEYSFNKTHEDLPIIPVIGGQMYNGFGDDHGTAVLGEMVSKNNTYGVKGIAFGAIAKFSSACMNSSTCNYNPANAINIAKSKTTFGDVILIEQQTPACGLPDYGPLEWDQSVYDAIALATAAGRIVVEAAGNGAVNLDAVGCNNLFNRSFRDSGAIIVGAGSPPTYLGQVDRSRLSYSTYGSRVDVQGWGYNVVTTGYGDLYAGTGKNKWYTATFSGTSSSSPIVAGAAAVLSSIAQQRGLKMSTAWIRTTLTNTGSPQQDDPGYPASEHIGPRPNLKAAIAELGPDFISDFSVNAAGWTRVRGTWSLVSGSYYKTAGSLYTWSSIAHAYEYTTLDFQAVVKRTGCLYCANSIIVRGKTSPLKYDYLWNKGYLFEYTNNGAISVWEIKPFKVTRLLGWTSYGGINANDWNTLRVTADEGNLAFYVNNVLVWIGSDPTLKTGKVGITMFRFIDPDHSPESFMVDSASMNNALPFLMLPSEPVKLGPPNTDWLDYTTSPH